jgi:hypothetical protein
MLCLPPVLRLVQLLPRPQDARRHACHGRWDRPGRPEHGRCRHHDRGARGSGEEARTLQKTWRCRRNFKLTHYPPFPSAVNNLSSVFPPSVHGKNGACAREIGWAPYREPPCRRDWQRHHDGADRSVARGRARAPCQQTVKFKLRHDQLLDVSSLPTRYPRVSTDTSTGYPPFSKRGPCRPRA